MWRNMTIRKDLTRSFTLKNRGCVRSKTYCLRYRIEMTMSFKKFCPELYKENNDVGINTALSLLNYIGYDTLDTTEAYSDRDFIVGDENVVWKVEAERSHNWKTKEIPSHWFGISVPYRKKQSGADLYVICNKDLTAVAVCRMQDVKKSSVVERFVIMTKMHEHFFNVPFEVFDLYELDGADWRLVKMNKNVLNVEVIG